MPKLYSNNEEYSSSPYRRRQALFPANEPIERISRSFTGVNNLRSQFVTSKAGIRKGGMFSVLARNCQPAIEVKTGQFGRIVAISKVL